MKLSLIVLVLVCLHFQCFGQEGIYSKYGELYRLELKNAPFPSAARDSGHVYSNTHYPKETHYNDSTVLVFVPEYLTMGSEVDIVVYFHGWNNNVDTVLTKFKLIEQFHASGRQAILVMPEGPKNAPDSFGGKLEETGRFKLFIEELLEAIQMTTNGATPMTNDHAISSTNNDAQQLTIRHNSILSSGSIALSGHSGAYRVIAYILMRGGSTENINEVILFDGLYADVEKYSYWLDHYNGRFINIYTPDGGTKRESENMMECLTAWNMPFTLIESDELSNTQLENERIIFIKSSLTHNEVISTRDQFKRFLETSRIK